MSRYCPLKDGMRQRRITFLSASLLTGVRAERPDTNGMQRCISTSHSLSTVALSHSGMGSRKGLPIPFRFQKSTKIQ